jgi:hypothetical protein
MVHRPPTTKWRTSPCGIGRTQVASVQKLSANQDRRRNQLASASLAARSPDRLHDQETIQIVPRTNWALVQEWKKRDAAQHRVYYR